MRQTFRFVVKVDEAARRDCLSRHLFRRGTTGESVSSSLPAFASQETAAEAAELYWMAVLRDVAFRDAEGFFHIVDRKSDMIIRGGENIYPREIDELLYRHESIAEAAAVGVPDELYGEEVAAFVVLKDGHAADAARIARSPAATATRPTTAAVRRASARRASAPRSTSRPTARRASSTTAAC